MSATKSSISKFGLTGHNNNNNNNFISCSTIKLCPHQKAYNMHASKRKKIIIDSAISYFLNMPFAYERKNIW